MSERKAYSLPEEARERLKRDEMNAVVYFRCALAAAGYCWGDLRERLERIPNGKNRFKAAMSVFSDLMEDLNGTVPKQSMKRLSGITRDYKIGLIPKAQSEPQRLILDRADAETVMQAAMAQCGDCYKSDSEARQTCALYKVLETYCPLDDYGNGLICQYGKSEIE